MGGFDVCGPTAAGPIIPGAMKEQKVEDAKLLALIMIDCPACKKKHQLAVNRRYLREAAEGTGDVQLYCLASNATWKMSEAEKQNTRKAFAKRAI